MFDDKIAELNRQSYIRPPLKSEHTRCQKFRIFSVSEEMPLMPLSKRGILVRFASEEQFGFQKEVLMPGLMKIANPVKYATTPNRIINKTSAFEYHIAKRSSLAI